MHNVWSLDFVCFVCLRAREPAEQLMGQGPKYRRSAESLRRKVRAFDRAVSEGDQDGFTFLNGAMAGGGGDDECVAPPDPTLSEPSLSLTLSAARFLCRTRFFCRASSQTPTVTF